MEKDYSIFRTFQTLDEAKEMKSLFKLNGIDSIIADNKSPLASTFSGSSIQNSIEIRINQTDFKLANDVLIKEEELILEDIDKDYYLFQFSNEELYEILLKRDEWSTLDYALAKKILSQKGKPLDEDLLNSLKNERLKLLSKPDENQEAWILGGYIFSLLGGFLGLIIGYFLWTSKKTLPNGEKVFSYSEKDRKHGKYIFYLGLIIAPFVLYLKVVYS